MFKELGVSIVRGAHNLVFKAKIHSPEILLGVGTVSVIAGVVLCCKATLKVEEILDWSIEEGEKIDLAEEQKSDVYSEEDAQKDRMLVKVKTAGKLAKEFAPGVIFVALGVSSYFASFGIIHARHVALLASYEALDQAFDKYRERVIEAQGKGADTYYATGFHAVEPEVNADGTEGSPTLAYDKESLAPQTMVFDQFTSVEWRRDIEQNRRFLMLQQKFANEKLYANGHLFLNEVLDMLGMERTKFGCRAGWIYDPDDQFGHVDFGVMDGSDRLLNGVMYDLEPGGTFLLDFNLDGMIDDYLNTDRIRQKPVSIRA